MCCGTVFHGPFGEVAVIREAAEKGKSNSKAPAAPAAAMEEGEEVPPPSAAASGSSKVDSRQNNDLDEGFFDRPTISPGGSGTSSPIPNDESSASSTSSAASSASSTASGASVDMT